ncbi:hypothetical protein WN943_025226 [Citrus x changshan-huyou]
MEEVTEGYQNWSQKLLINRGSQVLGIIPRALKSLFCLSDSPTGEELVVSSMQERITEMLNHADAFILLPRDLATLERLTVANFFSRKWLNMECSDSRNTSF